MCPFSPSWRMIFQRRLALFKQVRRDCAVRINVLIRPRFGDFLYSEAELEEMEEEIKAFRDLGRAGRGTDAPPDGRRRRDGRDPPPGL